MIPLTFTCAALAATPDPWSSIVDAAAEPSWSDGLVHRMPAVGAFAATDGTAVLAEGAPMFGQVTAGGAARLEDRLALGATATVSAVNAELATGPATDVQTLGSEVWLTTAWRGWEHGVALGLSVPVGEPSHWYLRNPGEGTSRTVFRYVAQREGDHLDVALETRFSLGGFVPAELAEGATLIAPIRPWLAASVSAEVGLAPLGTAMVGLHLRPVDHAELGATLATPFPLLSPLVRPEPQVGLVAKAWL